jgi:hypothetical protein
MRKVGLILFSVATVVLSIYLNYLWYGITPGLKWLMGW